MKTLVERHEETRRFLETQQELSEGRMEKFGIELGHNSVLHEPIIVTRPYRDGALGGGPNITVGKHSRIDGFVKIEGGRGVAIGDYVHIASFSHINAGGGRVVIENGAAVASRCVIIGGGNAPEGESCSAAAPLSQQVLHRDSVVTVGKNACLYAGVILTPGVTIGEGARIAAGAVVTHDVPAGEIWGGVPARFMRLVHSSPDGVR
jgi:acetyltransferase-like isoleucine patch superfamily enzyme